MTDKFRQILLDMIAAAPAILAESTRMTVEYLYPIGRMHRTDEVKRIPQYSPKTGRRLAKDKIEHVCVPIDKKYQDEQYEIFAKRNNSFHAKITPDDSMRYCYTTFREEYYESLYKEMKEFADHLIKFEPRYYKYYGENGPATFEGFYPVFEDEWNDKFYNKMKSYISDKAAWCSKYGCD